MKKNIEEKLDAINTKNDILSTYNKQKSKMPNERVDHFYAVRDRANDIWLSSGNDEEPLISDFFHCQKFKNWNMAYSLKLKYAKKINTKTWEVCLVKEPPLEKKYGIKN